MINQQVSKRKNFISNTSWIISEKIIQMVIQLVVGMISVRYLGPENYGTISYVASIISLFNSICTLGLEGIIIKKFIEEPENVGEIIGTSIVMRIISSIVSILGIITMIYVVDNGDQLLLLLAVLQSMSLIFMSFEIIDFWFQSKLNSKYVSIARTIATITTSVWKICLLVTSKSIAYFAFSTTLQSIVVAVILYYIYFKQGGKKMTVSLYRAKMLISESYHFILSGLMVVIYTQMDKFMIGNMIGNTQVGIYTAASNIPGMYIFIFLAIINSSRPIILEEKRNNEETYIKRIKQLYSVIIWSSIVIGVVTIFVGKLVVNILYGEEYISGSNVLLISTWTNIFSTLGTARGIWVVAENKNKYSKKYLFWGTFVNVILNSILIPYKGIEGAAIATLITQVTTCIIAPLFYKETRIHTRYILEAFMLKGVR